MQHKHHDLIVAWAKGAKIVFWNTRTREWEDSSTPQWTNSTKYKIKPETEPDVVVTVHVNRCGYVWNAGTAVHQHEPQNLVLILDGETGKLKDAQVLASSAE